MGRPRINPLTLDKVCPTCKKIFTVPSRKYRQIFCGRSCKNHHPDIIKSTREAQIRTSLEKYGVEHPMKTGEVVNNFKSAMKKKYGVEHALQSNELLNKLKQTKLKKYGDEFFVNPEKSKQTCMDRYGVTNVKHTEEVQEKYKKTCIDRYGVDHASKSKSFKIAHFSTMFEKFLNNDRFKNFEALFLFENYTGVNNGERYKFKCKRCNKVDDFSLVNGLPLHCTNCDKISMPYFQLEIYEFIKSIVPTLLVKKNDRTIISPLELDIVIPDLKIAFECNGLFWHSEIFGRKYKNYHLNKTMKCIAYGFNLIHILEPEWNNKKEIVKSIIRNLLHQNVYKIFARNCIIKEITAKECNAFLNLNHLQGEDLASFRYGLYYNNELISVMTFCKSRFDKKVEYEMSRFCNKLNTNIVGGANKLFKHFIEVKKPSSIISYNDRKYFSGMIYHVLGFDFVRNTPPNYFYIIDNYSNIRNRMTFQKHKLHKILPIFDEKLSEWENMKANGYDRVWDCGNGKWVWRSTKVSQ